MSLPSPAKRGAGRHGGLGGGGAKRSLDGGGYEGRLGVLPFGARCPRRPIGLQKVASLAYSVFNILFSYFGQIPSFIYDAIAMAMFSRYFASDFGSTLHHRAAAAAATLSPSFPRIVWLKQSLLSTSTASGNDRPTGYPEAESTCPMSDFLLNECGLCHSEISTIFKKRPLFGRTRSTHTARQAVQFLRDSGLTEDQVRKIITRNVYILCFNAERQLKPKFEFFKTLGFSANAISGLHRLFGSNLEKTVYPNIQYLQNLFGSETDISKVLKQAPEILAIRNGPEYLGKKLKHLASFGLLEDEIKEIVWRRPRILNISMDKVQKNMDFFIHTVGLPPKFILTNSQLLDFSLECRIKPLHRVLKSISAMQPVQRLPSLSVALGLSELTFLEKYVNCSPHATKLSEIYSGKPVNLDIIQ